MGGCESVDVEEEPPIEVTAKKVPRENLVQTRLKDTEIVRRAGDIAGNPFSVDELTNCKVIVMDVCDSMMIDRCINCELILSAVRGSIFVRDCENSKFQMVCGQFRCRSCVNCEFYMHVKTGPVVESSADLSIGCSTLFYPELTEQMNQCGLDPTQNCWTDIHDFTPGPGHFEYKSGSKLNLSIMDNSGVILPFTCIADHQSPTFKFQIPEGQLQKLAELSQSDDIHLIGISRDKALICTFECDSREACESRIRAFGGTPII
jgi:protein XRP2